MLLTTELVAGIEPSGPTDPIAYYQRPLVGWLYRERINRGLRLLGQTRYRSALEIGYGAGVVLRAMADRVDELCGIDLDADPVKAAALLRRHGQQATLCQGSVLELPYESSRFEIVYSFSVFEHLHEYRRALGEVVRVLEPGGGCLLGMPRVSPLMEIGFRLIGFRGIEDHHVTTPAQLRRVFDDAGLAVVASSHLDLPWRRPAGLRLYHNWLLRKV